MYDVQFNKILNFKIDIRSVPGFVNSHRAFRQSSYLDTARKMSQVFSHKIHKEKLIHFQIILDTSRIDVLAEDFSSNLILEL